MNQSVSQKQDDKEVKTPPMIESEVILTQKNKKIIKKEQPSHLPQKKIRCSIDITEEKVDSIKMNSDIVIKNEIFNKSNKKKKNKRKRKKKKYANTMTKFSSPMNSISKIMNRPNVQSSQWDNYKSITSIISRKFNVTEITKKAKYLRKKLTAASFLVYDLHHEKILLKAAHRTRREMASLTKIATFYTVCQFFKENDLDIETTLFEITSKAAWMRGTSAKLLKGLYISVKDLLYGLMLPSGNDAAMCLAENIGRLLRLKLGRNFNPKILNYKKCVHPDFYLFVDLMNQNRKILGMKDSFFMNPHGLNNQKNFSTCEDLLLICKESLKIDLFREVVKCKEYKGTYYTKRSLVVPKQNSFQNLKKIDIESERTSQKATPNVSNKEIQVPLNSEFNSLISNDVKVKSLQSNIVSTLDFSKESTGRPKRVSFSKIKKNSSNDECSVNLFSFDFSKKSKKSILRSTIKIESQKSVKHMYNKGEYLLNRKKKKKENKMSNLGVIQSKRQFYNKMRGMFIKNIRKKEENKSKVSSEIKSVFNASDKKERSNSYNKSLKWNHKILSVNRGSVEKKITKKTYSPYPKFRNKSNSRKNSNFNLSLRNNEKKFEISGRFGSNTNNSLNRKLTKKGRMNESRNNRAKNIKIKMYRGYNNSPVKRIEEDSDHIKRKMKKLKTMKDNSIKNIYELLIEKELFTYDKDKFEVKKWKNSNILLMKDSSYQGIKTGNTPNAKYCLASLLKFNNHEFITSKSIEGLVN
jgi:D-alanyl-D-alanine carboxypeptidase